MTNGNSQMMVAHTVTLQHLQTLVLPAIVQVEMVL